jgi:UDP-N-acetylglucosamine/UDP-N-acetylgalactosamine diphosphorylase
VSAQAPIVPSDLLERLRQAGQSELAATIERGDGDAGRHLAEQAAGLDLELVQRLVERLVRDGSDQHPPAPGPPEVIGLPADDAAEAAEASVVAAGEALLRSSAVGLVLLAGGQGTRLGFDGPKGDYPFAPVTGRTLFAHHAAKVAALRRRYRAELPWYVMTSTQNDEATRESFQTNAWFGLAPESVHFFVQGMLPAVDRDTGAILLEAPDRIALSPDGHGGLLRAMRHSGVLDDARQRGVRTVFTFQVDNPLLRLAHPRFLGHHVLAGAEMSSLAIRKLGPDERMGVFATVEGRTVLVEYSDLPDELAHQREPDGSLTFWAGSPAVHCLEVALIERLTAPGATGLPFHRAEKRVPYITPAGHLVEPDDPNAVKFEAFIFDALPLAERVVTVESERAEDFSPIKNASGADSPDTARRDLNRLYARWLESAGVHVPRDEAGEPCHDLEIDPLVALDADELRVRLPAGLTAIDGPTAIGFGRPLDAPGIAAN